MVMTRRGETKLSIEALRVRRNARQSLWSKTAAGRACSKRAYLKRAAVPGFSSGHVRMARYRLGAARYAEMLAAQGGLCAICATVMVTPHVDHDHTSDVVRGLLCNRCNIRLSPLDDPAWMALAQAYLGR